MRDRTTFTVTTAVGAQLRALANKQGLKTSDYLAGLIAREYKSLAELPPHPPIDIMVETSEEGATFTIDLFDREHRITLTPAQARSLAITFEHAIEFPPSRPGGYHIHDVDAGGYEVHRKGAGVIFVDGDYRHSMPVGIARSIQQELEEAAQQYP